MIEFTRIYGRKYYVEFRHEPELVVDEDGKTRPSIAIDSHGRKHRGYTFCNLFNGRKKDIGYGEAACSARDQFTKSTGRKVSLARAMKAAKLNKKTRTKFWKEFIGMGLHE